MSSPAIYGFEPSREIDRDVQVAVADVRRAFDREVWPAASAARSSRPSNFHVERDVPGRPGRSRGSVAAPEQRTQSRAAPQDGIRRRGGHPEVPAERVRPPAELEPPAEDRRFDQVGRAAWRAMRAAAAVPEVPPDAGASDAPSAG